MNDGDFRNLMDLVKQINNKLERTHAKWIEVVWDEHSHRLWINSDEGCIARVYNVQHFHFRSSPPRICDVERDESALSGRS